jgi:hypothetical protein
LATAARSTKLLARVDHVVVKNQVKFLRYMAEILEKKTGFPISQQIKNSGGPKKHINTLHVNVELKPTIQNGNGHHSSTG